MIISRTPFRVSFFGGGTDFPEWFEKNGGAVLSTTIDKYCHIICRRLPPFFEHKHRIVYSKIETVMDINQIEHPSARAVLKSLEQTDGIEIHYDGDLPARSGLGSSSAFTVGILNAVRGLNGKISSKQYLANKAIEIEQDYLNENVGWQDQIAVAYGGLNQIKFLKEKSFDVTPIICSSERVDELQKYLMLFYTGITRISSDIAKEQKENIYKSEKILKAMQEQVDQAIEILVTEKSNIKEIGFLLNEAWKYKRSLSGKISNPTIDDLYSAATHAGAIGGKILGAGGGGFILLFAEPEKHEKIKQTLNNLVHVPFKFEREGSRIVYFNP